MRAVKLGEWEQLEQIILSGQMTDADLQQRLRENPLFAEWLRTRAEARQMKRAC